MLIDEWMEAAFMDDMLVANALLGLKKSSPELKWGYRKRRSRPAPVLPKTTRLSPTTPLSWNNGNANYDSSAARSKGAFANESLKSAKKRSSKKRSFAELKEEENLLLKERLHLEKNLESARMTVKEQREVSKKLKSIKFNLGSKSANKIGESLTQPPNKMNFPPMEDAHSPLPKQDKCCDLPSKSGFSDAQNDIGTFGQGFVLPKHNKCADLATKSGFSELVPKDIGTLGRGFLLPDLNMELLEDGTIPETVYGIS